MNAAERARGKRGKLLDVTLREVGLVNGFSFDSERAGAIVAALDRAAVDIIEVGYLRSPPPEAPSSGAYCDERYLEEMRERAQHAELAVMVHTKDVELDAYAKLPALGVGLVRFPISARNADEVRAHALAARAAGLCFCFNATRMTEVGIGTLVEYAHLAEELGASAFYVADSNGSLYPQRLESIAAALRAAVSLPLGFHAHDNLSLAFANTLVALRHGFSWIDGSLGGAGKGGGNLSIELVAGHLAMLAMDEGAPYDSFVLSRAHHELVMETPSRQREDRFCQNMLGLLDMNMDRIGDLSIQTKESGLPLVDLLEDMFRARLASSAKRLDENKSQEKVDS